MTFDYKHFVLSHLIWIVAALVAFVGVHSYMQEHDAHLLAVQQEKVSEATIKSLQQGIAARDSASAQQVQTIVKVVHDTTTPQQAAAALPAVSVSPLPAPIQVSASNDWIIPQPDVLPIFQQLADDKICREELKTAQADLVDTKAIVGQKQDEINVLKKPQGFWKRVKGTAKSVGIGIGIGITAARFL